MPARAKAVHEVEVFGPAATVVPYANEQDAAALVARGGGSLVASIYGEDEEFLARMVSEIGPSHGRILAVDPAIASAHTGHGIVMPQCNHGGPGRAGAGEELGGLHGLRFYHQRLAVQGSSDLLASLQAKAASIALTFARSPARTRDVNGLTSRCQRGRPVSSSEERTARSFVERHGLWSDEQFEAAAHADKWIEEHGLEVVRLSFPGPARHPARQDGRGGRGRRHDAQRLLAHHHAARQGHRAQDGVSGLHRPAAASACRRWRAAAIS